jgi:hypothetical protein
VEGEAAREGAQLRPLQAPALQQQQQQQNAGSDDGTGGVSGAISLPRPKSARQRLLEAAAAAQAAAVADQPGSPGWAASGWGDGAPSGAADRGSGGGRGGSGGKGSAGGRGSGGGRSSGGSRGSGGGKGSGGGAGWAEEGWSNVPV